MSVLNMWQDENIGENRSPSSITKTVTSSSTIITSDSHPTHRGDEIFQKYMDIINSKSSTKLEEKYTEINERPFDFYDDEEFAFGINLLNNNVACVGDNMTVLIQMAQEPWPDNVKLFQPYEVEQILLPDNASCLAVQAFLKMCNLPFEVEMRWNAEFMSPSGRVPFIKCGAFVVSELEPIVQFAANKGVTLCGKLSSEEKAEMRAYMSLIANVLVNAELYISWIEDETYNAVTKVRNSSVYPWPLGWLQTRSKRNAVARRLRALHWGEKSLEQVLADVEQCCNSLSQRLGERDYFFGTTPTPLDALLYGHLRALLSANGPKAACLIRPITCSLLKYIVRLSTAIGIKLTSQEEALITQAFRVTSVNLAPERVYERAARIKRSKLCARSASKESVRCSKEIICGFKPFAAKNVALIIEEGKVICKFNPAVIDSKTTSKDDFSNDLDDVFDEVDEISSDSERNDDKNDFELVYPYDNTNAKLNEYLDIIEEHDTKSIVNEGITDNMMHMMHVNYKNNNIIDNFVEVNDILDSDGVINDKHLESAIEDNDNVTESDITTDSRPSELDALVFGHVFTIITTRLPCRKLADTVRRHETLVSLAKRVDEHYFKRT